MFFAKKLDKIYLIVRILDDYELECSIKKLLFMKKLKNFWTHRYWINAIGWCVAVGFLNNCFLWAFFPIGQVDWAMLLTALGVMLTISGARDIGLDKNHELEGDENQTVKRRWITATGWFLALGFFNNAVVAPYYSALRTIDWWQLLTALGIMLGISGTRDVIFYKFQQKVGQISGGLIQVKEKAQTQSSAPNPEEELEFMEV